MTLTSKDLLEIKKVVTEITIDTSHTVLDGVQKMFDEHNQEQNARFDKVENRLDNIELDVKSLKDEINGLKGEFSQQVSKKEFNQFKSSLGITPR